MRTLAFLFVLFCFAACQQPQKQYFESSPEIDIVRNAVKAVRSKDWEGLRSMYADTAKIAMNAWTPDKFITVDQHITNEKAINEIFSELKISDDIIYSMVVTDKGEKWVFLWFNATVKTKTGIEASTPIHEALRFVGDKVVFHFAAYNELPLHQALQATDSVATQ